MFLKDLFLVDFKNFSNLSIDLDRGMNIFVGPNGSGKTNLLDAIHYLSMTKSAVNPYDSGNISYGSPSFSIRTTLIEDGDDKNISCVYHKGGKKIIKVNDSEHDRLSHHIGVLPVIMVSPADHDLIHGGNEYKRRFIDGAISQTNSRYLQWLLRYNKALKHRNALLRQFEITMNREFEQLHPYDHELLNLGKKISETRQEYILQLQPVFDEIYDSLGGDEDQVELKFSSLWMEEDPESNYQNALKKDLIVQRTTCGSHRDRLDFLIDDHPIHRHGSQGQQKTFIVSLKFSQYKLMCKTASSKAVILLDDIFDKLDEKRVDQLMTLLASDMFGQIFLTDARPERTINILEKSNLNAQIFEVRNGDAALINEVAYEK